MRSTLNYFYDKLAGIYSRNEIQSICFLVMQSICNCTKASLYAAEAVQLTDEQQKRLDSLMERLQNKEPIQYIIGSCQFFDIHLNVNRSVLIPRPETEELVEWILKDNLNKEGSLFDICTGSGCIAITIKKYKPTYIVSALDLSEEAIATAQGNAEKNGCEIRFITDDILAPKKLSDEKYDIIVSNPPYVKEEEKTYMDDNVLNFEPHMALFVPDENPLLFYEAIGRFGLSHLNTGGKLYFEINEALGQETVALLEKQGYQEVTLKKDIFGKDRMVRALL